MFLPISLFADLTLLTRLATIHGKQFCIKAISASKHFYLGLQTEEQREKWLEVGEWPVDKGEIMHHCYKLLVIELDEFVVFILLKLNDC